MYESPVTEIFGEIQSEVHKNMVDKEQHLITTISQQVGYQIDKEELIKALKYDRQQYVKGYNKGYYDGLNQMRWIPCDEREPKESGNYWCTFGKFGGTGLTGSDYFTTEEDAKEIFDAPGDYVGWRSKNVIAWMPLPTSYVKSNTAVPRSEEAES